MWYWMEVEGRDEASWMGLVVGVLLEASLELAKLWT